MITSLCRCSVKRSSIDQSKGKASISYPIDGGSLLNVVLFDFEQETWKHEKWVVPADPEVLRSMFSEWGDRSRALVEVSMPSRPSTALSLTP